MGLPGAGKTTLAEELKRQLAQAGKTFVHFNADEVRKKYNDWDFTETGRMRQSIRMRELADSYTEFDYAICDFVTPLVEMRNNFKADWTIWVDTIRKGRYADTNAVFQEPEVYDFRVTEQDAEKWASVVAKHLVTKSPRVHL